MPDKNDLSSLPFERYSDCSMTPLFWLDLYTENQQGNKNVIAI